MTQPSRETLRAHRQVFWDAWQKAQADLPLNAMEVRIARVIKMHPEYHHFFNDMEDFLDRDFQDDGGMNPYLHLSLHLALEEQIATHQPPQVATTLEHLMQIKGKTRHEALHTILEILTETLHASHRQGMEPDVMAYAERVKGLTG
ncbi:MAG: hypothetical protein COW62_03515 [Zetaproteobacteria bacterium CG17_big_fil_post_rev_8_21_14_2_50_50_13]|nr:MAG: hypothetical protein AUJ57_07860 [Zetaproteobacteria bacterium CG1_02_53_45]PIQ34007.1 MAG: hypothetical protein COW62_03515 [Zetaproteobacteria bacterium CG17_big_fil_post_rev_8_21_14_2_50_50_13]PIY56610.1 MAG: DUF1841 domain-containing protein [Zetaproteobacteria bacterium CG_4_10_14_0_8_um_filter_49_80]